MTNLIGLLEFYIALSKILLTACADQLIYNLSLTKLCSACVVCSSKPNRWLFIISKIDIIWSIRTMPEFINFQLWTTYKIFLSLKYLFRFFLTSWWLHFLLEYWRVTSWKYSRSNIAQTSSLCCLANFQTPSMKMCSAKEV